MVEGFKPKVNAILRPLALFMLKMKLSPNALTLIGVALIALAAWQIGAGRWIAALILVICGAIMDLFDGLLAREGGLKTTFGAILDSTCDRITEILWTLGLLVFYVENPIRAGVNWGVYLAFAALTGSVMVSYIKARCEGAGVPCSGGILQRPERVIIICVSLLAGPRAMVWGLGFLTVMAYVTVVQRLVIASRETKNAEAR